VHARKECGSTSVKGVKDGRALDVGSLVLDSTKQAEVERVSPHPIGLTHSVGKHAADAALGMREQGK